MESYLISTVKLSTPLLLAALGELAAERSGVINIGIEGLMLTAAFFGMLGCYHTGSPWAGLAAGTAASVLLALLFAAPVVGVKADQVVAGMGLNLLALGLTGTLYRALFGITGAALTVRTFHAMPIPGLARLPLIGPALFRQDPLVYLALASVPLLAFVLQRTHLGLALRASGEAPRAADTAGVPVNRLRVGAVLFGGLMAGLGGCYLSLAHANTFIEGMSAGRGFIALAIVIFGRWQPLGVLLGAFVFGAATAAQFQFQAMGLRVPYQFFLMLPYVVTLALLGLVSGRARGPAALGIPYERA